MPPWFAKARYVQGDANYGVDRPGTIRGRIAWEEIGREWDGKISGEAIGEAIAIAPLVVKHEPFRGFYVGAGRKRARRPTALAA